MGSRTRARTADRDRAIDIINAAYADGQLGEIVRENRIETALRATTLGQLRALTQDLQRPGESGPPRVVSSAQPAPRRDPKELPPAAKLLLGGAVAVLALIVVVGVVGGSDDPPPASAPIEFTVTGESLREVWEDYQEQFDTTATYQLVFSPAAVAANVPTDDGRERYQEWRWSDGEFREVNDPRTAQGRFERVDLAGVDFDRIEANMRRAEAEVGVEDPDDVSVWIDHATFADQPTVRIQVANAYGELGYVYTDLAGEVIRIQRFGEE